jgi:hypothetical protein
MNEDCPKICDLIDDEVNSDHYELVLEDHVTFVDPLKYNLNCEAINPHNYFITSGDAIQKTLQLIKDYEKLCAAKPADANKAKYYEYILELANQMENARTLLSLLYKAKGDNIFLETEWCLHKLYVLPKNPRIK